LKGSTVPVPASPKLPAKSSFSNAASSPDKQQQRSRDKVRGDASRGNANGADAESQDTDFAVAISGFTKATKIPDLKRVLADLGLTVKWLDLSTDVNFSDIRSDMLTVT
jgi:hypothetical protein